MMVLEERLNDHHSCSSFSPSKVGSSCKHLLKPSPIFPLLIPGQCELYGDPHYISFQGVDFDFLDQGTYILVEEQSTRHNLTIAVDNIHCVPGFYGSCVKGIILRYHNNVATLTIVQHLFAVQVGYIKVLYYSHFVPPRILICIIDADKFPYDYFQAFKPALF